MRGRVATFTLLGSIVLATLTSFLVPTEANQATTKVYRIGWLVTGSPTSYARSLAAFQEGLQSLGYNDGRNIIIEYRWADGNPDRLPSLAADLAQLRVDLILAGGSSGALAAKNATRQIPIVMAGVGDPVELGLVTSLARPGGNLTGFSAGAPASASKRLSLLKETVPAAKRVAVLWNSSNINAQAEWKVVKDAATVLGLALTSHEARNVPELDNALGAMTKARADSVIILNDPFMFTHRRAITDFAAQARLPGIYGFREFVDAGGLMSYGPDISDTYRRAAGYVDKILKGAKPADLPVEQPTKFELVINLKTAKALGLTIPPSLLLRADQVIE